MLYLGIALAHLALALILFSLVNWIGKQSEPLGLGYTQISLSMQDDTAPMFNYLFKVLAPVVFMILVATLFQSVGLGLLNSSIYWVVIDYWVIRFLVLGFKGRLKLLNWKVQIIYWVSSIGLAWAVYSLFEKVDLLPTPESLIEQMWLVIILFLYSVLNKITPPRDKTEKRIEDYIKGKYLHFHSKYEHLLDDMKGPDKAILYSIMIYEDFNRPEAARMIENVLFRKSTKKHTYGVMQVASDHVLSDEESILLAKQRIASDKAYVYKHHISDSVSYSESYIAGMIAQRYNPGDPCYGDRVAEVFSVIYDSFYKRDSNCNADE